MDSFCLRRNRDLLHLPSQKEILRELTLSSTERKQYDDTKRQMSRRLGTSTNLYSTEDSFGQFHVQLQLRILCNHGTFLHPLFWLQHDLRSEREDQFYLRGGQARQETRCSLCKQSIPFISQNEIYRMATEKCAHVLCDECLEADVDAKDGVEQYSRKCPVCSLQGQGLSQDNIADTTPGLWHGTFNPNGQSTKVSRLMQDLRTGLYGAKSIVFSCWTKTLDLIGHHLNLEQIKFSRIDGETTVPRRQRILTHFEESDHVRVLIMTTGTGAFGLNLAAANRIFIVEPQWNPSVENQAIARALRFGQTQHVKVIRYVMKGTVETEMRSQQIKKKEMASIADSNMQI
jgi:SWI/SNF-related matrix-associated actin-dependent regulator of chromatin subfamily A3